DDGEAQPADGECGADLEKLQRAGVEQELYGKQRDRDCDPETPARGNRGALLQHHLGERLDDRRSDGKRHAEARSGHGEAAPRVSRFVWQTHHTPAITMAIPAIFSRLMLSPR